MKKKIIALVLLAVLLATIGCSRSDQKAASTVFLETPNSPYGDTRESLRMSSLFEGPTGVEGQVPASSSPARGGETGTSESANFPNTERKLVKRANISMIAEKLEEAEAFITNLMNEYNAYAASARIMENDHYYSLRVPAEYYNVFLDGMNGIGTLYNKQETTEDVTLRYYDLEGRLATKRELLRTYQSYLGRADNINEILSVEAHISTVQHDIESTGTQLRNLANQIDYATIELHLWRPVAEAPAQTVTFGEKIKQLFGGFGGFLSTIALILLGIAIYGIPCLLLFGLFFWLFFGKVGLARKLWGVIRFRG